MAQTSKESACNAGQGPGFDPWVGKDPLEEGMTTHASIPPHRTPRTEEPVDSWGQKSLTRLSDTHTTHTGAKESDTTERHTHTRTKDSDTTE